MALFTADGMEGLNLIVIAVLHRDQDAKRDEASFGIGHTNDEGHADIEAVVVEDGAAHSRFDFRSLAHALPITNQRQSSHQAEIPPNPPEIKHGCQSFLQLFGSG